MVNFELNKVVEDVLVFVFATAIPALYSGHMFVAEKIARWFAHPETSMGIGLTLFVISTIFWVLMSERFLTTFRGIVKTVIFVVVLYLISAFLLGAGKIL